MENKKEGDLIIILGMFILLMVVGVGAYYLGKQSNQPVATIPSGNALLSPTELPSISPVANTIITSSPPTITPTKEKAPIVSTEGWKTETISNLSFKIPVSATFTKITCLDSYEYCYHVAKHDINHFSPPFSIYVKEYLGGSRRQEADLDPDVLEQYIFKERLYGKIEGLDALFNCKIRECLAFRNIIFVVGDKLVKIMDGVYKNEDKTSLESNISNTIISTFTIRK